MLIQASQIEHLIMCQYLYASFSLKTGPDEGLTAEQAEAVRRWHTVLTRGHGGAPVRGIEAGLSHLAGTLGERALREQDPAFQPGRPVIPSFQG